MGKIFRSTNGGTTIQETPIDVSEDWSEIYCVTFDPANTQNLYAGGSRGLYKSVNKGLNWSKLVTSFTSVTALIIDPKAPKTIYAASHYGGVYVSKDNASTWLPMKDGLISLNVETMVLLPQKNVLLAGTRGSGVYRYNLTSAVAAVERPILPEYCALLQNYPNPSNPTTTIPYQIFESGAVVLKILNLSGQEIRTLVQRNQPAGRYSVEWNGTDNLGLPVSSGIYLYQIRTQKSVQTRKLMLIK